MPSPPRDEPSSNAGDLSIEAGATQRRWFDQTLRAGERDGDIPGLAYRGPRTLDPPITRVIGTRLDAWQVMFLLDEFENDAAALRAAYPVITSRTLAAARAYAARYPAAVAERIAHERQLRAAFDALEKLTIDERSEHRRAGKYPFGPEGPL